MRDRERETERPEIQVLSGADNIWGWAGQQRQRAHYVASMGMMPREQLQQEQEEQMWKLRQGLREEH